MNVIDLLRGRGLLDSVTSEELRERCEKPMKVYIGFDPTADSLHLGNLVGMIVLRWFQKCGHTPFVVLGGATGRIGDPSGKSTERPLLDDVTLKLNVRRIRMNFEPVLDFFNPTCRPHIVNNDDWYSSFTLVNFLRDVGKHFRVGTMLGKEMVRNRIESEEGISFTEFSYQILQAYDFYHLFQEHGVSIQGGGSDQWGNITAGVELIRKLTGKQAFGITTPLLTRSDGKKFGKSEGGAIWLAEDRCSPYQLYQYLYGIPDADIIKMLRMLTFLDLEEIAEIEASMSQSGYIPNTAQRRLAEELTRFLHGEEGLEKALRATEAASPGRKGELDAAAFQEIAKDMPHVALASADVIGQKYVDIAVKIGLLVSKGEVSRLIQQGGAYLNNDKVEDIQLRLDQSHLIGGEFLLFSAGKKKKILIKIK